MSEAQGVQLRWGAENVRLTTFVANAADAAKVQWADVGGSSVQTRRSPEGARLAIGPFAGGALQLYTTGTLIEWKLQAAAESTTPIYGDYPAARDAFLPAVGRWLADKVPAPVVRVAYGAVLLAPSSSEAAGVRALAGQVHSVRLDDREARDFLFRVNRPVASVTLPKLYLNRVGTWSVIWVGQEWRKNLGEVAPADADMNWYARLETDVNTARESTTPIPPGRHEALLEELVAAADRIVEGGEP